MADRSRPSLVADPDALRGEVERPLLRDFQLKEIRACVSSTLSGSRPIHGWIHGPAGSGKTLCTNYLLKNEVKPAGILPVTVNCREHPTLFSVLLAILDVVKPLRSAQRTREHQLTVLRTELGTRSCVIALDEVDVLEQADLANLVHHLCALSKTAVLCIAASRQALLRLPDSVKSRLAPRQILFPRYHPEEVVAILRPTIARALRANAWTTEAIQRVADLSYGDARRALVLLRHAVQRAEESGATRLKPDHLVLANFSHFKSTLEEVLEALSSHHRMLYDLVCVKGPIPGSDLETEYRNTCARHGLDPVSSRTVSKYLGVLAQRGILEREHGARTAGWIYRLPQRR